MGDLRAAAQQALKTIESWNPSLRTDDDAAAINALRAALEQEEKGDVCARCGGWVCDPVVAQQEQEPVAWRFHDGKMWCYVNHLTDLPTPKFEPLYTHPPRREWQGLTEEEVGAIRWGCRWNTMSTDDSMILTTKDQVDAFARAVEAALKELNT